jgi:hypothetical protein
VARDHKAADNHHRRGQKPRRRVQPAVEQRLIPVNGLAPGEKAVVRGAELLPFQALVRVGLDRADARQAFLRLRVDLRDRLQVFAVYFVEPPAELHREQRHHRQEGERDEAQLQVDGHQDRQRAGYLDQIDQKVLRAVVVEFGERQ